MDAAFSLKQTPHGALFGWEQGARINCRRSDASLTAAPDSNRLCGRWAADQHRNPTSRLF